MHTGQACPGLDYIWLLLLESSHIEHVEFVFVVFHSHNPHISYFDVGPSHITLMWESCCWGIVSWWWLTPEWQAFAWLEPDPGQSRSWVSQRNGCIWAWVLGNVFELLHSKLKKPLKICSGFWWFLASVSQVVLKLHSVFWFYPCTFSVSSEAIKKERFSMALFTSVLIRR